MIVNSNINEGLARKNWGHLSESVGLKANEGFNNERIRFMTMLAEVKNKLDGPGGNISENNLLKENYNFSNTSNVAGIGPSMWPSDPGHGVGAQQGAWDRPGYKAGSGDVPSLIMGMALNVAAYCIGFDLLTTIAVDMPTAIFQFLDSVYAGGSLDGKEGQAPIYFQVEAKEVKDIDFTKVAYGDKLIFNAGVDGVAIKVTFMGRSFINGNLLVKWDSVGKLATDAYTVDNATNVADAFEAIGAAVTVSTTNADGTEVASDSWVINDIKLDTVSSVREHVTGFSKSDGVTKTPMTRATLEQGTGNKLNLKLWSKTTEIKGIEVIADITKVMLRDLKAYGVDGLAMLYKAAQNQLIQDINDHIVDHLFSLGVKNAAQLHAAQGVNLNLFIAPAGTANKALSTFGVKFEDPTGADRSADFGNIPNDETNSAAENQGTRQRKLSGKMLAAQGLIATVGRYGEGNVAVVNGQIGSALKNVANFVPYGIENTIGKTGDLHFIGTIGSLRVYQNPKMAWGDTRILVANKGTEETPGAKLLAYDLAQSVEIISENTFAPKISVSSRYEIIDAGFYPELQYFTFAVNTDFANWN